MKKILLCMLCALMAFSTISACRYAAVNKAVVQQADEWNEALVTAEPTVTIDFSALCIAEHEYPPEFTIGTDLQAAITQLALCYETFDAGTAETDKWKETFVSNFIQNSRLSFEYLDRCAAKNNGSLGTAELEYIQYSLTGMQIDMSSFGTVNAHDNSSHASYGRISDWSCEDAGDELIITADFELGYGQVRDDDLEERELTVKLAKNPYSCFDGYSIVSLSSVVIKPWVPLQITDN